jgi:hypothetical protein
MQLSRTTRLMSVLFLSAAAGCTNGNGSETAGAASDKLIGSGPFGLHPVPSAQPKSPGTTSPTLVPPELVLTVLTQGSQVVFSGLASLASWRFKPSAATASRSRGGGPATAHRCP